MATPYSKYQGGIEAAYVEASKAAAWLVSHRVPVFSPIAHSHPIALYGKLDPLDHSIWLPADSKLMDAAYGLLICMMPGWMESYGIEFEIKVFKAAEKPIVFLEWPQP